MKCDYCEIEEKENYQILYEDEQVVAALKDSVFTPGQITIFPKKHFTIFEQVPDDILAKCAVLSNKVSVAVFEGLDSKGTNVLIQNGLAGGQKRSHFGIEIIPRREGDGLNFEWTPTQYSEDEIDRISLMLKETLEKKEKEKDEPIKEDSSDKKDEEGEKKENYLLKSLDRLP